MLKVNIEIWTKREDIVDKIGFPASKQPAQFDLTDYVLQDGIKLTSRLEWDSIDSIAFDECEITFTKEAKKIIDTYLRQDFLIIAKVYFDNRLYFKGIIDNSNIIENKYNETYKVRCIDILRNLMDFWDKIPIPFYDFDSGSNSQPSMFTISRYKNVFETLLEQYQYNQDKIFAVDIHSQCLMPYTFQNNSGAYHSSYKKLSELSYKHFYVNSYNYDKFSGLDLLIECAKYQGWCLFYHKFYHQIYLVNKFQVENGIDITDSLLEDYEVETDYKPKYEGIIFNLGTHERSFAPEGHYVFKGDELNTLGESKVYFIGDYISKNKELLDLRYNLYSNFKDSAPARWTRGITINAVVFYSFSVYYNIKGNKFYIQWNTINYPTNFYNYFNSFVLKNTRLIRAIGSGLNYQVGKNYKIENFIGILVEADYDFENETTKLLLRV